MADAALIWGATIVYIAVMVFLGYLGWKKTHSGEDYLLAGKNVHPIIIGLSYGSTFISTSAIVGFGGYAAGFGMGIIWLAALNIAVGLLFAFVFFGKRVRRLGQKWKTQTFPEFLGRGYNSKFIRWFVALVILVGMPLYAVAVLLGGASFMSQTIPGIDMDMALIIFTVITAVYVISGGLRAVMYTDALQGVLMMIGMLIILAVTISLLGGIDSANQQLTDMAAQVPAKYQAQGMNGWTAFPDLFSENWLALVFTIVLPVGIGVLAQPQLAVRFMTAKDAKSLNRAVPWGGVFLIMMTGVAFTIGAWSNVYFYNISPLHMISLDASATVSPTHQPNLDLIIPLFINSSMDQTVVVLFMLTLLAAAMSTLSSLFHVMGSAAGYDLWASVKNWKIVPQRYREADSAKASLRINQVATLIFILISLALAWVFPRSGGVIAIATAMFFGVCASAFLPLFVCMLFSKRPSKRAAEVSLIIGTAVWFFWMLFVYTKDSSVLGISKALFNTDTIFGKPWSLIDPIVIALPLSTIALIMVWLFFREKQRAEPSS